jgi:hypothetical protein
MKSTFAKHVSGDTAAGSPKYFEEAQNQATAI